MMYSVYRSYLFFVLVLYLLLICMLHTQLQLYDKTSLEEQPEEDLKPTPAGKNPSRLQPFHGVHAMLYNHSQIQESIRKKTKEFEEKKIQYHKKYVDSGHILYKHVNKSQYVYDLSSAFFTSCKNHDITNQPFRMINIHYLYSAYYDDRRKGPKYIRIIALLRKGVKPNFYCHFKYLGSTIPVLVTFYEMCENHAKDFGGWILSCEVPEPVLSYDICDVKVTINSLPSVNQSVTLPVIKLSNHRFKSKQQFGLCVPPLFGSIPSITLIEFIELSRLLGVDHVTFYDHQTSREISKVLNYYSKLGIVTAVKWNLPVPDRSVWYHGQLVAINDCLYRQQHRFQYLAFNDIDEFIVPHTHSDWSQMVKSILNTNGTQQEKLAGLSFQSAFFDPLLETNNRILFDLESDLRTKTFSKVRTKVLIRPENVFELGIHHISKTVQPDANHIHVSPEDAFIHHYRKCTMDFDPTMTCQVLSRDQSLTTLLPALRHNVHHILWTLKEIETENSKGVS